MATNYSVPLTNSRGLGKVVFFSGLKFPVALTPSLMGEPIITSQAFYFLERLDSVARTRFEEPKDIPSEREMEYVIDNYLFEYSKRHPDAKLTSKITEFVYSAGDLLRMLGSLLAAVSARMAQARTTSSGETISALNLAAVDIIKEYAGRVYQLRNACIHSKKTRKGVPTPRIAPSTAEEDILKDEMPVMQWLAVQCIEKR